MFNCELMAGIIAISATLFRVAFEIVEKLDGVLGSLLLRKWIACFEMFQQID